MWQWHWLPASPTSECPKWVPEMLLLAANIAGWFAVSIFLTLYNKLSVTTWGMDFPLTIATVHLVMRMPMAAVAMRCLGVPAARFSWRELFVSVFPMSALTALRYVENKGPAQVRPARAADGPRRAEAVGSLRHDAAVLWR